MGPEHPPESIEVGSVPDEGLARGKQIFSTHTVTVCTNDLALVLLDRDLDLPIQPIELASVPRFDDTMTVVGYGKTDSPDAFGRQRRTGVPVLDIGVPPRTFTLGPGGCKGDSGGPAINERTGAVTGVYSAYIGDCGSAQVRNFYTSLSSFDELILGAFEAAGATPWLAGEPEPMPDGGEEERLRTRGRRVRVGLLRGRAPALRRVGRVATPKVRVVPFRSRGVAKATVPLSGCSSG